ncbi:MAG TPA: adenylate/guanylate cyclase domain-containing protein [Nitriliruptorales bacterium]
MSQDTTVRCGQCSTGNPGGARFCMGCGGSLEVPCPSCGTELPPAARFCFNCGHDIEVGATAQESGQTAQQVASGIADQLREITVGAGERRTITMLFCDVKDSTATAEQLDPEAWSDIMHEAMACFAGPVERYGGTVARLLGDAILAYFGAPVAHEDDPQRALLAALAILECSRDLCIRVREQHSTDFDVRVGINTGLVVVGAMGSERFGEYAALGDAANVAARMEQTAEPGTIRIAEPTYRLIAPLFDTEPVGTIDVKGRTEPIAAYTVVAARGMPGQVRGIQGLSSPMVGREQELAQLVEAVEAVQAGGGRIVAVTAEAGLGKSRLVSELRGRLEHAGLHWIAGQCHSYEDTTPYAPFIPALHDCLDLHDLDTPAARTARVLEIATDVLGESGREQGLYLCTLLGLPLDPGDRPAVAFTDPGTLRGRVFDAVAALLEGLSSRQPVVLELEDLHWADPTSIELVHHLLPVADRARILLLLLFRPRRDEPSWTLHEAAARDHAHRYTPITLSPLDDARSRELVGHLLRVEGLSPSVREAILAKAEGNPFFVEEVIRSLLDDGTVVRDGERFVATRDLDGIEVPDTLGAVLRTRLDRLEPATRTVVHTASVLGRDFSLEMLRLLVDPGLDLDGVLTDLERRELVFEKRREPDVVFSFKHALTRDAAYQTLLQSVRRDLHRVVGKLVEERYPDRVFDLAWHFAEADEPVRAVPYLVAAGEQAFAAFSREDAARYFRRALDLWDVAQDAALARRAYEGLGQAEMFLGRMTESIQTFDDLLAFAREHGDDVGQISALNKGGLVVLLATGDAARAEAKMVAAHELAEASGHQAGVAEFHVGYCFLNVSQGRLDQAEKYLGEAAEVCFALDAHHRNFGLTHYATTLVYQVRFDEARSAIARAREQAELDQALDHLAELGAPAAIIELFSGSPARARPLATDGFELAARIGANQQLAALGWIAGSCAAQLGDLEEAQSLLRAALGGAQVSGNTGPGAAATVVLATIEQVIHGPGSPSVRTLIDQARALYEMPLSRATAAAIFAGMGADLIVAGDLDEAQEALTVAATTPSATSKLFAPEIAICLGGVAFARGRIDEAETRLHAAADLIDAHGLELYRPRTLLGQAAVAVGRGQLDRAVQLLEQAEAMATDRLLRLDLLSIQRTAVALLANGDQHAAAAGFRERAGDTVAEIAGRLSDHELRRTFLRTNATMPRPAGQV